jgi:hypothetical protein
MSFDALVVGFGLAPVLQILHVANWPVALGGAAIVAIALSGWIAAPSAIVPSLEQNPAGDSHHVILISIDGFAAYHFADPSIDRRTFARWRQPALLRRVARPSSRA